MYRYLSEPTGLRVSQLTEQIGKEAPKYLQEEIEEKFRRLSKWSKYAMFDGRLSAILLSVIKIRAAEASECEVD